MRSFFSNSKPTIANRKITMEQMISAGRSAARQVISGIIQRETSIPGIRAQITDNNAIIPDIICFASIFFNRNKRILETIITQAMTAIVIFAL
jgi:hypothetical protein